MSKRSRQTSASSDRRRARKAPSDSSKRDVRGDFPARESDFTVIGIGASAGGLEPIRQILRSLPEKTNAAFLIVQHLQADRPSELPAILARETKLNVREAREDIVLEPDNVFVIPPNKSLSLRRGRLHLESRPRGEGRFMVVDHLFESLARDVGTRAVGVVLSGTDSDGVAGLKAIKEIGGVTFAQDPKSAQFDQMPRNAESAGWVDFVLPPSEIAASILRIANHAVIRRDEEEESDGLKKIFEIISKRSGVDFQFYKHSTLQRRILRRMLMHHVNTLEDYIGVLEKKKEEVDDLYNDLLIQVTNFFRDPETFDAIKKQVLPEIIRTNAPEAPIRVWVPGCASGEEAYSIAMVLMEFLENSPGRPIQIFGTDISESAIARARAGVYPEAIKADVSANRLRRFFVRTEGGYQISKQVRDLCIFARQNVCKEPPFSRLDLISCRNLLIYLGPQLQKKVMPIFHYALKPHGFLMLGTSESVGGALDLFAIEDKKNKIYSKKSIPARVDFDLSPNTFTQTGLKADPTPAVAVAAAPAASSFEKEVDAYILGRFTPSGAIISDAMDVVQFRGRTSLYLEHPTGQASLNIVKMAKPDLALDLRSAIQAAIKEGRPVRKEGLQVKVENRVHTIALEVTPLRAQNVNGRYYLVLFQPLGVQSEEESVQAQKRGDCFKPKAEKRVMNLEKELEKTRQDLHAIIEAQEVTNEELKSANEEIQSSNEELQSTNEELETAKEELQSTNEELTTVNEELQNRNSELSNVNNDLTNVFTSVNIPIVIVGADLRIRRYTPMAERLLNLIPTDVGRPVSDIKPNIDIPNIEQILNDVIEHVVSKEVEAQDREGRWYSMRVQPYKTREKRIEGATIAYLDITALKRSMDELRTSRDYAEAIIRSLKDPKLMLDSDLRVAAASQSYLRFFGVTQKETVGNLVTHLGRGQWAMPELRAAMERTLAKGTPFDELPVSHKFQRLGHRTILVSGRRITASAQKPPMLLLQFEESNR